MSSAEMPEDLAYKSVTESPGVWQVFGRPAFVGKDLAFGLGACGALERSAHAAILRTKQ